MAHRQQKRLPNLPHRTTPCLLLATAFCPAGLISVFGTASCRRGSWRWPDTMRKNWSANASGLLHLPQPECAHQFKSSPDWTAATVPWRHPPATEGHDRWTRNWRDGFARHFGRRCDDWSNPTWPISSRCIKPQRNFPRPTSSPGPHWSTHWRRNCTLRDILSVRPPF
jgi:hypothetical protein